MHRICQGRRTAACAQSPDNSGQFGVVGAAAAQFSRDVGGEEPAGFETGIVVRDETVVGVMSGRVLGQVNAQGLGPADPVDRGRLLYRRRGNGHREHPCLIGW